MICLGKVIRNLGHLYAKEQICQYRKVQELRNAAKIGVIIPMTGQLQSCGEPIFNSIKAAIDESNAVGGIKGKSIQLTANGFKFYNCNNQMSEAVQTFGRIEKLSAVGELHHAVIIGYAAMPKGNKYVLDGVKSRRNARSR